MINRLKQKFGNKCSGIVINSDIPKINIPSKKLKLCEAINYSFDVPVRIDNENLGCPGARRSVGFNSNDQHLARLISENNDIPFNFILEALQHIPSVDGKVKNINLGITEELENFYKPDLYILYVHPDKITELMHMLARLVMKINIPNYSFLSICGNVFASTYRRENISVSFGCPESRKFGGVENNEVILGIPARCAEMLAA